MHMVCYREVDELAHQGHLLARHRKGLELQSLQLVPCRQDRSISGAEHFVSLGHVRPTSSPVSEKEKTARQRIHRQFGVQQDWFFYSLLPCDQQINAFV